MKNYIYILAISLLFLGCSEYQKILKSQDTGMKFKFADSLYQAGKYAKSNKVFAQIVPKYRGKPQAQKLMFLYAKSFYQTKDYHIAMSQLDRFVNSYPRSEKIPEAMFLAAKSAYKLSSVYSKDQAETLTAIEKLQLFINAHGDSEFANEANNLVKELDSKLEKKAFEIAKNYHRISDFQAAIKSFEAFVFNFPGSSFREEVSYYKYDAASKLAINSVERKKKARLEAALSYYNNFIKKYPNSQLIEDANKSIDEVREQLNNYNTKA